MSSSGAELDRLARFGALPAFDAPLHVGRPNLGDRAMFMELVEDLLDRRWLTNDGPMVRRFEDELCALTGAAHCIAMCNGTTALEISARALELRGEVIVPGFTFVATAHALRWQEIEPSFADIRAKDHLLDPSCIEPLIGPATSAIVPVHLWGQPADETAIEAVAERHGLEVLYDAAHAFGVTTPEGESVSRSGRAAILSFHATKFVNAFEGGAIVTDDDALASESRLMRNFGFTGYDEVGYLGINGKMTEVCAAMGLASLRRMSAILEANEQNYRTYAETLGEVPGLRVLDVDGSGGRRNYQYVVAELDEDAAGGLTRDALIEVLWADNIRARRYFAPGVHRMEPYRSRPGGPVPLPVTDAVSARVVVLPTGESMDRSAIETVCGVVERCCRNGDALMRRLSDEQAP